MFKRGDIILINFPYTDLSNSKKRPALVISDLFGDNIIVCQISTKYRNINDFKIELLKINTSGNIKFNSNIYIDMIFTLHKDLIITVIGNVNDAILANVDEKLNLLFNLN